MYKLQDVLIPDSYQDDIQGLYYRGNGNLFIKDEDENYKIRKGSYYEFFTYFNSVSAEKWKKYTSVKQIYLIISIKGKFKIQQFGHFCEANSVIKKEWLGSYVFKSEEMKTLIIPFPKNFRSSVIAFSVEALSGIVFGGAYYAADLYDEYRNNPFISLATTTFKKEQFINRNIEILKDELFSDEEFKNAFCWKIVDNGCTLDEYDDGTIKIMHNKNVGGAGGFAKGMIESLRMDRKPSHILLMDDDVNVSTESFRRLYRLLNILRPEYKDYFVSGAMLNMDAPNIQHENTGVLVEEGYCVPVNSGFDLTLWDKVVLNERIRDDELKNRYAAWWFCCIPTTIASLDNLPLPVFVRGDDMEYSIRNHAKFITMNGISIWHQGFVGKFNAVMDFYQSKRNELIVFTSHEELSKVDSFGCIEELIWQALYKFDYFGAELLIDAIEDYMRGPEWFSSIDLFEKLSEKRRNAYKPKKITPDIRSKIDYENLYTRTSPGKVIKFIYDYSCNGQIRVPEIFLSHKIGVIPAGFLYMPEKQLMVDEIYMIDTVNDTYIDLKKDRVRFKQLKNRFEDTKKKYLASENDLTEQYRNSVAGITNSEFWDEYLE